MPSLQRSRTFRFVVGSPQNVESFVWRMWVHGNDVYLGVRDALTVFKVSLHQSGIWRIAFVADLKRPDMASDRVIVKWRKPNEFAPGWTPSIGIVVSSVRPERPFKAPKINDSRLTWFGPPAEGKKLVFKVLFSSSGRTESDLKSISLDRGRVATHLVKKNGDGVWLVVREDDLSDVERDSIRDAMEKTRIHMSPGSSEDSVHASRLLLVLSEDEPSVSTQPTIIDIPLGLENVLIPLP
jgi:hypothetical protein